MQHEATDEQPTATADTASLLPQAVNEQPPHHASVYSHGKLVYDGANLRDPERHAAAVNAALAAPPADGASAASQPFSGLNEMLKWGIENSDPTELQRRAAAHGATKPSHLDQEVLDLILGQPSVAKMRSCLAAIEDAAPTADAAAQLAALEELEFYVEDLDNANDFAKIGGLKAMRGVSAAADGDTEVRAAACGVLAACVQNNPELHAAAYDLGLPSLFVELLSGTSSAAPVRRKALLALSALMRGTPQRAAALLGAGSACASALGECAMDESDPRLRARALRLVLALLGDGGCSAAVARALVGGSPDALVRIVCSEPVESDLVEVGAQLLLALSGEKEWCRRIATEDIGKVLAEASELDGTSQLVVTLSECLKRC